MQRGEAAAATAGRWVRWGPWCAAAVVVHAGFCLARVPHAVFGKRIAEVAAYWRSGDAVMVLATAQQAGAEVIAGLRATTPADAVVVIRGERKGALEWAPALLWPRLCCAEERVPPGTATYAGRPVAPWLLIGEGPALRVEPR